MSAYPPSPVPSDADLWPDELPFTAFGQFGIDQLDLRVFDQDVYWVDRYGTPHELAAMSELYQHSVIAHLHENADMLYSGTLRRYAIEMLGETLLGWSGGAHALALAAGDVPLTELSPQQWLEATPLMRRLRRLTGTAPHD